MVWEFRPDEPLVGEGPWLSTRRGRLMTVAVIVLLVVGIAVALVVPRLIAAQGLDPALNSSTGLADGQYTLVPTASFHEGDQCWFRGSVDPGASEITVYGSGAVQCAAVGERVGRVELTVADGVATITEAAWD